MLNKIKEKWANRKLKTFLDQKEAHLPNDIQEIVKTIKETAPHNASKQFQIGLRDKLLLKHKQELSKKTAKSEVKNQSEKNPFFTLFKQFSKGFTTFIIILVLGGLISYPFIPAPSVVRGAQIIEGIVEISNNAPFKVVFTQLMDHTSVEQAFSIEPKISGKFSWEGNVLFFTPDEKQPIGKLFKITVNTSAKSIIYKNLSQEYVENFKITGAPQVLLLTPAPGTIVDPNIKITVMFDRPMRALTTIDESLKQASPLIIEPQTKGTIRWLGTKSFQFIPDKLLTATHYKVTVPAGFRSAEGGALEQSYTTEFNTEFSKLINITPEDNAGSESQKISPSLEFNIPMDLESIQEKVTLLEYRGPFGEKTQSYFFQFGFSHIDVNGPITKDFKGDQIRKIIGYTEKNMEHVQWIENQSNWKRVKTFVQYGEEIDKTTKDKRQNNKIAVLKPENELQWNTIYAIHIDKKIKPFEGNIYLDEESYSIFKTAGKPEILTYQPGDYIKDYRDYFIRVNFSNPMNLDSLKKLIIVEPKPKGKTMDIYLENDLKELSYYFEYRPSTEYKITFPKGIEDQFGQKTEKEWIVSFKTIRSRADFDVLSRGMINILNYNYPPIFYIKSVNLEKVKIEFKPMDVQDFEFKLRNGYLNWEETPTDGLSSYEINVKGKLDQKITTKIDFNELTGSSLKPGIYYFQAVSDETENWDYKKERRVSKQYFMLTNTALTYKANKDNILLWVTDIKTGQPVSDIDLFVKHKDSIIGSGRPNAQGLYEAKVQDSKYSDYQPPYYVIGKRDGGDITFIESAWNDGIDTWHFNIPYDYNPPQHLAHIFTDRPIYRPGHVVYFKGIIRRDRDAKLNLPEEKEIKIIIKDSNDSEIYKAKLPLNHNGSFNGSLTVGENAATGTYNIFAQFDALKCEENSKKRRYSSCGENYSGYFYVEEYRKPDFKLTVKPNKESFITGEQALINIQSEYFFGGPLSNAKVTYAITSTDYYFDKYRDDWYSFSATGDLCFFGCSGESALVSEGEALLNENGTTQIKLPLEIKDKKISQTYSVEATVYDKNNQTVSNRIVIPIHKGEYYIGLKADSYVGSDNKPFPIKVISVDPNGKITPNKKIIIKLLERNWNTIQKQNVDGSYYFENSYEDKEIEQKSVVTDSDGKAVVEFMIGKGGIYLAEGLSTDSRGNEIKSETEFYIFSSEYIHYGRENNDRIELVPDKPEYKIGEIAKVLVKSPYSNVKALLTYERAKILEKKVIDIASNSHVLEIPITEEFLPNIFVSVVLVKGSGENTAYKLLQLENEFIKNNDKKTAIEKAIENKEKEITENFNFALDEKLRYSNDLKLQYELQELTSQVTKIIQDIAIIEGEKTALSLNSSEQKGEDAGIAGFKVGYTTLYVNTALKKLKIGITTNKEKYLPKDDVIVKIKTINQNGAPVRSEVSLSVVDQSILTLSESNIRDLMDSFYLKRSLGVNNANTLARSIDRINVEAAAGAKGGGGGLLIGKRANFKDSAYWNGVIETNERGEAQITFKLPDNLTTWQILAIASTNDTLVGSEVKLFKTARDIMIRPVLPRFLIINDKIAFGTVVHNETDKKFESQIYLDTQGISLTEDKIQLLSIEPYSTQKVEWHGEVQKVKEAKFKFLVEQGAIGDEVEIKLPVYPFSYPEIVATSGLIQESKGQIEEIKLPDSIDSDVGELKIGIATTLANSIADGIEALIEFPYGCIEQTVSKLLPNLLVKQIIDMPAFSKDFINIKDLDKNVAEGLQKIYQYQNTNGGWGLWSTSEVNEYLTAYVLYALHQAKLAGYAIDENVFNRGKTHLQQYLGYYTLPNQKIFTNPYNTRSYVLFVLSEIEDNADISFNNNLFESKDELNLAGKAYLTMAFNNILKKQPLSESVKANIYARINVLTNDLINAQKQTARGVHFEEETQDYYNFGSNEKTTALIFQMLVRTNLKNPLIEKILRHLLLEKKNGSWKTTQETVNTLISLIEYLKASKEFEPSYWGAIELNGVRKDEAYFSKDTLSDRPNITIAIKDLLLNNQTNQIKFVHGDGPGNLYYDINMQYYLPVEAIEPRDQGFQVISQYYTLLDEKELNPLTKLKVSDNYKAKVTLLVPEDRYYVVVDDKLPAGLEGINFNLKTSSQIIQTKGKEKESYDNYWDWDNKFRFNHTEVRDDRVLFFADFLPKGVYDLEFYVRATSSGKYHDKPAEAFEMYLPEVFGRSEGKILEITNY